jgi:hypothetical protein
MENSYIAFNDGCARLSRPDDFRMLMFQRAFLNEQNSLTFVSDSPSFQETSAEPSAMSDDTNASVAESASISIPHVVPMLPSHDTCKLIEMSLNLAMKNLSIATQYVPRKDSVEDQIIAVSNIITLAAKELVSTRLDNAMANILENRRLATRMGSNYATNQNPLRAAVETTANSLVSTTQAYIQSQAHDIVSCIRKDDTEAAEWVG